MSPLPLTPSQTVGPFFHDCLLRDPGSNVVAGAHTTGEPIRIEGRVLDGDGAVVTDAMVETWQANAAGRYAHPADSRDDPALELGFVGFGRSGTDEHGAFYLDTIKPGRVPFDRDRRQAPHIAVQVFARGLLDHLNTRIYFDDEAANDDDPILGLVPERRRPTLVAAGSQADDRTVYRLDIVLQGDDETVFFDIV